MSIPVRAADLGPAARGIFTTAHGGDSRAPWAVVRGGGGETGTVGRTGPAQGWTSSSAGPRGDGGLNLGPHVGDDPAVVDANRLRVAALVGGTVGWVTQVHGTNVLTVDASDLADARESLGAADALVVRAEPGRRVSVGVMVADCVPLLLADARGRAAAAVHVGRAGLVGGVVQAAIGALRGEGVEAADLYAHLGPSICGSCYEVPAELQAEVVTAHPAARATTRDGTTGLDIGAAVVDVLRAAGVGHVRLESACTYERPELFSYRRTTHAGEPRTGRFAGVVTIEAPGYGESHQP